MRIALFTDSDAFAGTERHMLELACGLHDLGEWVVIACPAVSPLAVRATAMGLPQLAIPKQGQILDTAAVRVLRRALRAGEIDLVHSHNGRTALAAALATRLAARGRCVATQHFLAPTRADRKGPKSLASKLAHGWVDRNTHGHIAISQAVRDNMVVRGEAAPNEIDVVPNGITPPEQTSPHIVGAIRDELGVPDDALLLVCACRLEPEKDVATLIQAMPLLPASPRIRLVIAGSGSHESVLRAKIAQWKCEDLITLAGFREDVMSLIAAADAFVLPSKAEPFGLVLLEAMSLGKPIVATAAGGPLEIVEQGVTGLLVPPSDPGALATALRTLILDPAARAAIGKAGLHRFRERFTSDRMAAQTLDVYRRVMGLKSVSTAHKEDPAHTASAV